MRNVMYLSFAAFVFAMSGCSNETFEEEYGKKGHDKLVATIPSVGSRTYMDGTSVKWSSKDKIGIFSLPSNSGEYKNNDYTLSSGAGTQSAEFTGSAEGVKKVAYYPYASGATYDGTKITYSMLGSYTYNAEEPRNNNGAPMACLISEDAQDQISFKNAGALIYITVENIPAGYTQAILTSQGGTNAPDIAGDVEITFENGIPTLRTLTSSNVKEASGTDYKSVTINFTASEEPQNLEFYFPIPVNTYPELNISVAGEGKNTLSIKTFSGGGQGVRAERGVRLYATVTIDNVTGEVPTVVENATDATEALKNSNAVVIKDVQNNGKLPEIVLPKKTDPENETASISFDKISTSNEIAIKESNDGEGTSAAQTVRVAIPSGETGSSSNPSFNIYLPSSTVTLDAVDGKATYEKVTAITAANTLIIKEGVTVNELIIAGGNVKVYGTVKKIALDDKNSNETTVTSYGSGVVGEVSGSNTDKLKFKSEWDGVSVAEVAPTAGKIYTAAQLAYYQSKEIPKATTGKDLPATMTGNVTLCADIDMKQCPWIGMVLDGNAVFDGANHTISNVRIDNFVLSEQSKYTPNACVGLFAATKPGSQIKNITIDGFEVTGDGADAKWSGALVGYSYGTTLYENCHATNVKIESNSSDAYRMGGLIGFIAKISGGTDKEVTLKGCSASNITIKGSFSIGGLVGTVQGGANRTFNNCDVSGINLSVNEESCARYGAFSGDEFCGPKTWGGYMSKFIGDINLTGTINIDGDCSVDAPFTEDNLKSFGYDDFADYTYKKTDSEEVINATVSAAKHYSLADAVSPFIPAQVDRGTITINGVTLTDKKDYNRFTLTKDVWDGTTKTEPQKENGIYQIKSAAELAWFQSKQAPTSVTAASLPATIDADAKLCVDINLNNKPWLGMVIDGKTFDGGRHTVSNLNMSQYLLNQQATIYTPEACIGLFAAVYGSAEIKDITLDGVTIEPSAEKSPKWVGSLVGYSKGTGTTYTNCTAKNVKILTRGLNSYRVGGLIGYIEKSGGTIEATATLTGCRVETANIAASFSYGGLVGSLFDSVTFMDCHTDNITLALNGNCTDNLGYVSKFIGDVTNNKTHSRKIVINNCSADLLTPQEQSALNFSSVAGQQNKSGTYTPVSPFVGIVDVTDQMTIIVDGKTLENGIDYNKYTE